MGWSFIQSGIEISHEEIQEILCCKFNNQKQIIDLSKLPFDNKLLKCTHNSCIKECYLQQLSFGLPGDNVGKYKILQYHIVESKNIIVACKSQKHNRNIEFEISQFNIVDTCSKCWRECVFYFVKKISQKAIIAHSYLKQKQRRCNNE